MLVNVPDKYYSNVVGYIEELEYLDYLESPEHKKELAEEEKRRKKESERLTREYNKRYKAFHKKHPEVMQNFVEAWDELNHINY